MSIESTVYPTVLYLSYTTLPVSQPGKSVGSHSPNPPSTYGATGGLDHSRVWNQGVGPGCGCGVVGVRKVEIFQTSEFGFSDMSLVRTHGATTTSMSMSSLSAAGWLCGFGTFFRGHKGAVWFGAAAPFRV